MVLTYAYCLTSSGEERVKENRFYLQATEGYRGYTEKIFRSLYKNKPLTIREISELTVIDRRAVNGVITFNVQAGYIATIHLARLRFP